MSNENLVEQIVEKLEDFGLNNITEETTVTIDHDDNEVNVFNSEFNTFTKAKAIVAQHLVDFQCGDPDETKINHEAVIDFVNQD